MLNYFQPWTSDKEPKPPKGWGIDALRNSANTHFHCGKCGNQIEWQQQYLYNYQTDGPIILHNTKECAGHLEEQ